MKNFCCDPSTKMGTPSSETGNELRGGGLDSNTHHAVEFVVHMFPRSQPTAASVSLAARTSGAPADRPGLRDASAYTRPGGCVEM
jgi:hypothetical protein